MFCYVALLLDFQINMNKGYLSLVNFTEVLFPNTNVASKECTVW